MSLGGSLTSRPCSPCNQNPLTIQPFDPTASPMTRIWQVSPSQLILRVPPNGRLLSVLYVDTLEGSKLLRSNCESLWQDRCISEFGKFCLSKLKWRTSLLHVIAFLNYQTRRLTRKLINPVNRVSICTFIGKSKCIATKSSL